MQPNLIELARQGNPNAISSLINQSLTPKGITAKASKKDSCIRIMLEASEFPDQAALVSFVHSGILKLKIANINTIQIFGRLAGDEVPAWSQTVVLSSPQSSGVERLERLSENEQPKPKVTIPEYIPSNKASDLVFGCFILLGSLILLIIPVIGWILGIIGIIGGIGLLGNAFAGHGRLKGTCPYCETEASAMENTEGMDCKGCKKRILIKDRKFYQV